MGQMCCTCNDLLTDINTEERVQIRIVCGEVLNGTIENVTDRIIQLEEVPQRLTNICCDKICSIRNLAPA